ncbi:MAG: AhpC/TSA family protein [Tannerella sp.]|jgi:thiol-disulfide isomerase/thioredoxin|nr:AhpC/TSA family protein [Tannerella sp.]
MKNLKKIAAIICVSALAACNGGNRYVIKGDVHSDMMNGETVYLWNYSDDAVIDSAKIANGKFVFDGAAGEAGAARIVWHELYVDCILEKGTIRVDMPDSRTAKGTPLNDVLSKFSAESDMAVQEAREKLMTMDESMPEAGKEALQEKIIDELAAKMDSLHISFLKEHPDDVLGAVVFCFWLQNQMDPSAEKFESVSGLVGEYVLNFGPVKQMAEFYKKQSLTTVGKPFVDFTIENGNRDGSPASLSDYAGRGKYVLVDFWASWCAPCRMETPVIAEVYRKYRGDRFEVVSVAVWDERENTLAAIEEDGSTWPQILDAQTIPTEIYGIRGIPHIMLIGPDGTILAHDLRGDALKAKVAEVMK